MRLALTVTASGVGAPISDHLPHARHQSRTKDTVPLSDKQGLLDTSQDVNDHIDADIRPIPFPNMIYVGDGPTDVPCFTVMKKNGGQAIAVYNPDDPQRVGFRKCYQLSTHADRVNHIAPADYRPHTHLRMLLEQMVEETANRIVAQRKDAIETGTVRAPKR